MKTWQDRLLELLDRSDYKTMTELCRVAGIATSTFSTALKGSHIPKITTLDKVARVLDSTSDYILNGDPDEKPIMVSEVPVLNSEQITDWLSLRLKLHTISQRIRTPKPVHKLTFAWLVDTVDMAPFTYGSTAIINPDFNINQQCLRKRIFVLAIKKRPVVHQVSFSDIETIIHRSESTHAPAVSQSHEKHDNHAALVELVKTICGYELVSSEHRSNRVLDFNDYQIVGRVKYAIYDY